MKKLIVTLALGFSSMVYAGGEIKEVCVDKRDPNGKVIKDQRGKAVQDCRRIKVHRKLEGTPVPDQQK